jgi:endonuclease/exonuclease/phosphatase family metal-dependent hydrolase
MSGQPSRVRRLARLVIASGLMLAIALGAVGQVARDRSVILALFMYLPLVPLGLTAVAFDAIRRGRALPRGRFVLGAIGLVASIGASVPMIALGPGSSTAQGPEISLLHWNVLWGGGKSRNPAKWASIRREILSQGGDLIVLSEAPPVDWLDQLLTDMGPGASRVQVEHEPGATTWFKLVVCSKGPLRLIRRERIANGTGMVVEAEIKGRKVRLLVVDATSNPLIPRSPRLLDVANICRRAREAGEPIDVVVGDFNSVSRSLGFDAIEGEGYALAARSARGWRGTFPSFLPVYDIDHVFVRRELPVLGCRFFTNLASDHRGQVARLRIRE